MTASIKALSDGLSGELQVGGNPSFRFGADTSGQLAGFRNRIINGDMRIDQRGTSFSPTIGASTYLLDRFAVYQGSAGAVTTVSQQALAPSGSGLRSSLNVTVNTADTSVAAGDIYQLYQKVEGYNVGDLIGKTFTLSFYVSSPKTGIHCVAFKNAGDDRSYILEYTVNSANTWEKKTLTVVGGLITAGTWNWTNGAGVNVGWALMAGAAMQTTPGAWQTGNFIATANQVNCLDTIGNIFAITGVQLELGSIATPFEHRPIGLELSLCQRYYYTRQLNNSGSLAGTSFSTSYILPVVMRSAPVVSHTLTDGNYFSSGVPTGSQWNLQINGISIASKTGTVGFGAAPFTDHVDFALVGATFSAANYLASGSSNSISFAAEL